MIPRRFPFRREEQRGGVVLDPDDGFGGHDGIERRVPYDCFISYASPDVAHARALHDRLAEHPSTLVSVNNLAGLYESQGRYGEAEPLYARALAASERVLGAEHPSTLGSVNNLAFLYESQGWYGEAEPLYARALAASERVLGAEHPHTRIFRANLARLRGRSQGGI